MAKLEYAEDGRILFTEEMKKEYTVLVPQMAPYHFDYLVYAMRSEGYKAELLTSDDYELIHEGMKYSHNDICVPAMLVIGQFIDALKKRKHDIHKVALIIAQTGGGCRASNYIKILRKALKKAHMEFVPVISLNAGGLEKNPGFRVRPRLIHKMHDALLFGDTVMTLIHQIRPYEKEKGACERLKAEIDKDVEAYYQHRFPLTWGRSKRLCDSIIERFQAIETEKTPRPKVGIVGEIYVKYSPLGNNRLEKTLENEGVEVVIPPLYDFFLYSFDSRAHDIKRYGGPRRERWILKFLVAYIEFWRERTRKKIEKSGFERPVSYKKLKSLSRGFIDVGTHIGEGWLLTAEMIDLIEHGAPNIVCTQPFGCLPNHIVGKGMIKKLKNHYPQSNIVPIDYDTSASKINQLNRITLMVSNAFRNFESERG